GLSPDGRWIAYGINRSNRDNELRVASVADGTVKTVAFASQPVYSADSRWVAYAIGYSEAQEEKLRQQKKPVQRKAGILNLATGEMSTVDAVESFAFDASGTHLALKRYAPERKDAPDAGANANSDEPPASSSLIVRHLASGRDMTFGNVGEFTWQDEGKLLAFTINADDKAGNGVQLFDPDTGALRVLDSSPAFYTGLTWRKDANDLAVLRAKGDDRRDGLTNALLAWKDLGTTTVYDPTAAADFPAGMRIVSYRRPSWSDDGRNVFVGLARWNEKPAPQKAKTENGSSNGAKDPENGPEEAASVDVWHARDVDVMPRQKVNARADRQRNLLAVFHLDDGRLVQLGRDFQKRVTPIRHKNLAYAVSWTPYAMERSIGRPAADIALVDLANGTRTMLVDRVEDQYVQASPDGKYILYLRGDQFWTIDTATKNVVNITKAAATSFINRESDATIRQKPPFGIAGWTAHDEALLLYDKFDVWHVAANGAGATKLTDGAGDQVRYRYVRLDPDEEFIDTGKPLHFSLFGIWTKRSGYAQLTPGAAVTPLVLLDKSVGLLGKAEKADVYAYVVQRFDEPPVAMVSGPDVTTAKRVVETNPFAKDYEWGRSELVEYKNERGDRLQGILSYPADYQTGRKYPMIVYMYERLSDGLHRWVSPSERDPYNPAVFTTQGYFVLQPDIVFRPREPGVSVADCVGAAVKRVIATGVVDPARIGIVGHSWGGFDTVYLATHTNLFAAGVAGAPITDLVSNYGNHHWSSGIAETDHIETGQQRMEVPIWEDLPAYIRNSAVFGVSTMRTPLLIAFGDNDGTVHFHQGVELYNIARRAKKDVVMLVYGGEDHSNRKKPNQIDYHRRILQWFGHYLKNEAAAAWIKEGVSFLDREQELKRLKGQKGS
ncbi:MAG TPA: prolyl oligopeptidase family serine peptidase, partial [Vicinamibacterales bacterium]|nr:prolyl oligopeptidase family serine peptidase [Vicinamibacterales bacterium]